MTESATHSPTPWREALDRLHYNARCNENRWHDTPMNADRDKEAVFLAHDVMVRALREAQSALAMLTDPKVIGSTTASAAWATAVAAEAKCRSTLSKSTPTQKGE